MASGLPPPPINAPSGSFVWLEWYRKLRDFLATNGSVPWSVVDKAGSKLSDIADRKHSMLQNVQGGSSGEQYHLTQAQWTESINRPSHGGFQNTASQTFASANTPAVIVFNTTDSARNMSLASNKVTVTKPGIYNIQFSLQAANTDTSSATHEIELWLRKNGTDIAGTGTKYSISPRHVGIDGYVAPVANFLVSLAASDYIELVGAVTNVAVLLEAYASQTSPFTRPSIPSSVITLTYVAAP